MTEPKRRIATPLLVIAIAACAALLAWRPWAARPTEERLRERLQAYTELRRAQDWPALYAMVVPQERKVVGEDRFLAFYGQGATELLTMSVGGIGGDVAGGQAAVDVTIRHRLHPERLPPAMRRGLRVDDEAALIQEADSRLDWVWQDGDWYFRLDRVVLTARDPSGRPARAVGR